LRGQKHRRGGPGHTAAGTEHTRGKGPAPAARGAFWLYGTHAARTALANPKRIIRRSVATAKAVSELGAAFSQRITPEPADPEAIAKLLPPGAVHQGIALLCDPLSNPDLETFLDSHVGSGQVIAVLDQITDPQNEGAILRSAVAFGVSAVIVQDRHAPPESGALAKAASGALDMIPRITVVNIARALDELGRRRFWRVALAGESEAPLAEALRPGDVAIVLGAEGTGIRRLVRENCDVSASIPMDSAIGSLNVSNAAAVAFYEIRRQQMRSTD